MIFYSWVNMATFWFPSSFNEWQHESFYSRHLNTNLKENKLFSNVELLKHENIVSKYATSRTREVVSFILNRKIVFLDKLNKKI